MLTLDELIGQISATTGKIKINKLTNIINNEQFAVRDLIDLTFHADKTIAFRAAWLLENVLLKKPELYINDVEYLVKQLPAVTHPGCKRHYAKIMMHITSPKAPLFIKQLLATINLEPAVEQLFDWVIDPRVLIAVKVFACECLFNLRNQYPWITEELANEIQFLMQNGTAAIQSKGRKLLAQL